MQNEKTQAGVNRTGIKSSPRDSNQAIEGAQTYTHPLKGDASSLAQNRIRFMQEAESLGTVPMPTSIKGMVSALQERFKIGDHTFMDKLGERIAFERTGSRLYEALISKYEGSQDRSGFPDISILQRFYQEEKNHFRMLCEAMEEIGGDSTAMSPAADFAGVAAMGWVQAISDPRTSFKQSLEIILQAELVDNDCWDILIELANDLDLTDLSQKFQLALQEEDVHLETIRRWVLEMNLNAGDIPESAQDQIQP